MHLDRSSSFYALRALAVLMFLTGSALAADYSNENRVFAGATLTDLDGESVSLSSSAAVTVVNFWATWCKPCRKELQVLQSWDEDLPDARFVAISIDNNVRVVERFLNRHDLDLTVVHDGPGNLAKQLDLPFLPCTFLLDENGDVAWMSRGFDTRSFSDLHAALLQQIKTSRAAVEPEEGAR